MPVIGMSYKAFDGKRTYTPLPAGGEIKVNSSPKITGVKEVDMAQFGKKVLAFEFEFVTSYGPDVAEIKIGGDVLFMSDKNAEIVKQWKKEKKLPDDVSIEVLNHLFRRCLLKISYMADDLQLPPPINMPLVTTKAEAEGTGYVG